MKKIFLLFLPFFLIILSCTEKPDDPPEEPQSNYSIELTPTSGTAYITTDTILTSDEVIELEVTIKKDGMLYTGSGVQVNFQTQGAYFAQTGTNEYFSVPTAGKAKATLFSLDAGVFEVTASLKAFDKQTGVSKSGRYTFVINPDLKVTGISSTTGSALGGEEVTIYGNGFVFPLEVYFGDQKATYISSTYNEITVQTPPHFPSCCNCNDVVDVKVTIYPKEPTEKSEVLKNIYTYIFEPISPKITAIDPSHGKNDGGDLVSIFGEGFYCEEGVLVYFGSVSAKVIECTSSKIIVETPPAYDVGVTSCSEAVDINVLNVCGGLSNSLPGAFKYGPDIKITALSQDVGFSNGGDKVTIYGQGFSSPVAVSFAGVGAQVLSVSNNEILVVTGAYYEPECSDHSGDVVVTDIDCGISASCRNCWTYRTPELRISYITPISGNYPGTIDIYGSGFFTPLEITFDESNALGYGDVTLTSIEDVLIPPFSGSYATESCIDANGCEGQRYINTGVDVNVTSITTGCSDKFQYFYYIPPDTTCRAPAPTCSISSDVSGCVITYTAESICGATYNWSSSEGTCTTPAPNTYQCTYTTSGTKTASVTIQNTGGSTSCSGSGTIEAGVNPACP